MSGLDDIAVNFRLNGEPRSLMAPADRRLIDFMREDLSLVGAKKACSVGRCGACTVLLDGQPANACLLMLWQLEGRDVVSPEGLDENADVAILRAALASENAFQCGYCAPGFVTALIALLRERPDADDAAMRAALEGNICRCTGYHSILRGARAAAEALRVARAATAGEPA
ncbi:2Fe-2S iron-sulfur cluster binding domain-containing protein [Aquibium carbonis]|uniref:2Fe-2S iron-sulfur cluster binding domain-containing protein n=1 Tax=Aquibium carbonis TaxID=2495581 RepID=A0A3R9YTK4_9HYPH|nr:2Fe-2S iron-sulfur cluster-binding protein [Aquibium carbonis]RST86777.1 2Fe-2S iron-sulfur cluster binding domain-containing protein [Aquibium carbonis]